MFLAAALLLSVTKAGLFAAGIGQRFNLSSALQLGPNESAQLFVPDYFLAPADGKFMLVFHMHGAVSQSEDIVYKAHANAVVFGLHLNGLSGVYQTWFSNPSKFPAITNLVLEVLRTNNIITNPRLEKLVLTSFSAGYAGIREILKTPANYKTTDALLLADSLYSSSDPATRTLQMRDFLRFAADARDRRKLFLLTHSSVATVGYDSTVQTADYLVSGIGQAWTPLSTVDLIGTRYRQSTAGFFEAAGYLGDTGTDHTRHFLNMHLMMERLLQIMASNQPHDPPRFLSVSRHSNQLLQLELQGTPDNEYFLEHSPDFTNWTPALIVAANTNPVSTLQPFDPVGKRFYRARLAATATLTQFESYAPGAAVMFQSPAYSGSTSTFLDPATTPLTRVSDVFPVGGANGARVLQATWAFKTGESNPWLRLTTHNAPSLPNPAISLRGALRFDIYTTKNLYVTLGLRETGTTVPLGANGGATGDIEWIGGSTQNTAPPLGRLVLANTWTRLVFFIPHEPIGNFVGDGLLDLNQARGTLEHLALVPAQGAGAYTVYLDNFQVIE